MAPGHRHPPPRSRRRTVGGPGYGRRLVSDGFPLGFFTRLDPSPDPEFYSWPRLVTHIDDDAIAAVGALYDELEVTRAIRGWLAATDEQRCAIVAEYFRRAGRWGAPAVERRTPPDWPGDPLFTVWAHRDR